MATVTASWRDGPGSMWDAQAASPSGAVRAELLPSSTLEYNGHPEQIDAPITEPTAIGRLGYVGQLASFADDVTHGHPPLMDAAFGRDVLEVVCATYWSAAGEGRRVALPFDGPRDRPPIELWRPT